MVKELKKILKKDYCTNCFALIQWDAAEDEFTSMGNRYVICPKCGSRVNVNDAQVMTGDDGSGGGGVTIFNVVTGTFEVDGISIDAMYLDDDPDLVAESFINGVVQIHANTRFGVESYTCIGYMYTASFNSVFSKFSEFSSTTWVLGLGHELEEEYSGIAVPNELMNKYVFMIEPESNGGGV